MPVLAWGGEALLGNIVPVWQTVAENVTGGAVPECGHFIPEEKPEFVIEKALEFFGQKTGSDNFSYKDHQDQGELRKKLSDPVFDRAPFAPLKK